MNRKSNIETANYTCAFWVGIVLSSMLLYSPILHAQSVYDLEAIRQELSQHPPDERKVVLLNQMAFELREVNQQEALTYARRAEALSTTLRDTLQLAKAKGHIGWINYRMGDWEGTFRYSREAYTLSLAAGDANETAMALNNLGALYYQQQDYLTAIERFREAYTHVRGTDHYFTIIRSLNNTALNFIRAEMPDSALHYANLAMRVNEEAGSPFSLSFPYRVIGDVHFFRADYTEAMRWYRDALQIAEQRNLSSFQASILHRIGYTLIRMGRHAEAMSTLKQGEELSTRLGLRDELSTTYRHLASLYEMQGNISEAFRYQSMHLELLNELESKAIRDRISIIQGMFEAERIQSDLRMLEQEALLAQEQTRYAETITRILAVTLVLIIAMLVWLYRSYRRTARINDRLNVQAMHIQRQWDELQEKSDALEQANTDKNTLFSILSHDLRTPVAQARSMLDLLNDNSLSREDFTALSRIVQRDVDHLFLTLDNLLNWSKSQMEGFKAQPIAINVVSSCRHTIALLQNQIEEKKLTVHKRFDEDLPDSMVDPDHLTIIIRNLLSNAIKFSHVNGNLYLAAFRRNSTVVFSVRDEGVGMPADLVEKIRVYKNDIIRTEDGTRNEKGHGLGLMLCKRLITMNSGELMVQSTPNQGSDFHIVLPVAVLDQSE